MVPDDVLDRLAADPSLAAPERDGRPVFVVDDAGAVLWAGDGARRLVSAGGLDAAGARTLSRMAASGEAGLVRLRLGPSSRLSPLAFRARPLALPGAGPLLVLEGVAASADASAAPRPARLPRTEEGPSFGPADEEPAERTALAPRPEGEAEAGDPALGRDPPRDQRESADQAEPPADDAPETPTPSFVFEFDAEGRLSFVAAEFPRLVGASAAGVAGRPWREIAAAHDVDPDGRVAAALNKRMGWTDIAIGWPTDDGSRLPIVLSALPIFDRGRVFAGFRGLGRVAGAAVPDGPAGSPADGADEAAALSETEALKRPQAERPAASGSDARDDDVPLFAPPPPPEVYGGNVVPLREAAPPMPILSSSEENAFDEIARRLRGLGARVTDAVTFTEGADLAFAPDTAAISTTPASDWTIDDVDGRAPTTSRVDDLLRLLDRLPVGALALRAGAVAYANRAALETLGHPTLASLQARGAEALFAEPPPRDDAAPATIRVIASDGLEVEVEARLSTIIWDGGPATLVSLKRAEGALAAAQAAAAREREVSAVLDVATDGVLTLDGAGRILAVNRGAETLFGFKGEDVVGSLFTLSLAPESRRVAFDYLDDLRAGAAPDGEGRVVLGLVRRGGAIPLHLAIVRVGAREDNRFCAALRDVTSWKKAEEEALTARRLAERANTQKSEFLAKISHEIRTPLNAIIGFAEVMMEERFGPVGSPRYKDYLRDINVSGRHLIGLVNDLLDITRIESGGLNLDVSPIDLNEIAAQAAALLQPQASRDHVIIRTSLARGLPPVLADRRSVRQILTNLASNAVRLSRPGGQVIVATAFTEVGQAVIRVRDAGLGMSKQELARALEPFRSLGTADNDAGAALGLPLTRALAEANEAGFALKSEIGQGTLAEVTFPASRVLVV
jgi:PAS domain S-box-containing protein